MEYQAMLPQGEYYYDLSTKQTLQQLPKADVPRKVVAFSCGGGSYVEYEQVKQLSEEKCLGRSSQNGASANGDEAGANQPG